MNDGGLMTKITSDDFRKAFICTWAEESADGRMAERPYERGGNWTRLMLGDGGFLSKVSAKLGPATGDSNVGHVREVYTVDFLIRGGKDTFRENLCYPSGIYAIVEHELGFDLEEEMWKLLHWRCPLKVLITYDWSEDEKSRSLKKRCWLDEKLRASWWMLDEVEKFQGKDSASYLVLIGDRKSENGRIYQWRFASDNERKPSAL
jgi:hypothetical protein